MLDIDIECGRIEFAEWFSLSIHFLYHVTSKSVGVFLSHLGSVSGHDVSRLTYKIVGCRFRGLFVFGE